MKNKNKIINQLLTEPLNLLEHFQNVFLDMLPYKKDYLLYQLL